jgi:hypothetical protein
MNEHIVDHYKKNRDLRQPFYPSKKMRQQTAIS